MSVPINQEIIGQNQKDLDFSQATVEPCDGPSHGNMYWNQDNDTLAQY